MFVRPAPAATPEVAAPPGDLGPWGRLVDPLGDVRARRDGDDLVIGGAVDAEGRYSPEAVLAIAEPVIDHHLGVFHEFTAEVHDAVGLIDGDPAAGFVDIGELYGLFGDLLDGISLAATLVELPG